MFVIVRKKDYGFTLIEILIVLAIITIITAVVLPAFGSIRENQVLKSAVEDALSTLDKAKSQTLASVDSSEYGVHLQSDKMVLFKGTSYSSNDPNNQDIPITPPASISNIALSGGGTDLYFARLTGVPNKTGTVTISSPTFSKIITIGATGIVSVN